MRNKTNVDYVKIGYTVNGNKTECSLTYEIDLRKWPLNDFKINSDIIFRVANKSNAKYYETDKRTNYPIKIGFEVSACATCDNIDSFDKLKGQHIALSRAQAKAFERTCKFYDNIQFELDKSFNDITRIIDNNYVAANKCWKHAKELGGY